MSRLRGYKDNDVATTSHRGVWIFPIFRARPGSGFPTDTTFDGNRARAHRGRCGLLTGKDNLESRYAVGGKAVPSPILAPVIVLVLWTLVMCAWLYATRIPALKRYNVIYDPQRPSEEFHAQLPPAVRWKADNYNNLLEQPTVFYAVSLTLAFLDAGSGLNAGLAWVYVALRIAHSLVQSLLNKVMIRFVLFAAASFILALMTIRAAWIIFLPQT